MIVFRHINGRIVPIEAKQLSSGERKQQASKAAAQLATGAAASGAAGVATAKAVKTAHKFSVHSRAEYKAAQTTIKGIKQLDMFSNESSRLASATKNASKAINKRMLAKALFKSRGKILAFGGLIAAPFLAKGALNAKEAAQGHKESIEGKTAIFSAATGVAGTIAAASYYRALPIRGLSKIVANVRARLGNLPRAHQADWFK